MIFTTTVSADKDPPCHIQKCLWLTDRTFLYKGSIPCGILGLVQCCSWTEE